MSRKVFTAGEVLAAADVNSFLMDQTVMSFAGTAARGSAIGTAVEGMTTYREDTNRIESWTGSEWQSPGDLVLIKTQTIGSAVSSVTVTSVFSADFDNYKVVINGGVASTNTLIQAFLGTVAPANGYYLAGIFPAYSNGATTAVNDNNASRINRIGYGTTNTLQANVDFESPFLTKNTIIRANFLSNVTNGDGGTFVGFLNNSTSFTDFTITSFGAATMTGGTIQVFGYRRAI
jgi:hypothetical protein